MTPDDVVGAVELQKSAFPPPFDPELHWDPEHLLRHIELFPDGQFVADCEGRIVGSCSNSIITEERWQAHAGWGPTVGGPYLRGFTRQGTTLYGLDITVHPEFRRQGIAKGFYHRRFDLVRQLELTRYGTGCRIPGWRTWSRANQNADQSAYARVVNSGRQSDPTLTPLLHMGLTYLEVIPNYMPDPESGGAGVLLEWLP